MSTSQHAQVLAKLCPHRGVGEENSLDAIQSGIKVSPFLVEFDTQWHNNDLYLGHPPDVSNHTLREALILFRNTAILPKIDIKLTSRTSDSALRALIDELLMWSPRKALINIAGDLNADEYFEAEIKLIANTNENVLLNIDLDRYSNKDRAAIDAHIKNLKRIPFSISPNLETNTLDALAFARQKHITHVHFWSYFDKQYSISDLHARMELCEKYGLQVYFDIKFHNLKGLQSIINLDEIKRLALPSNFKYGEAIYKRGAVEIIERSDLQAEAWVGGLDGAVTEGAGSRRRTTLTATREGLAWHCAGNPKNHQIFCKHCVALALVVLSEQ